MTDDSLSQPEFAVGGFHGNTVKVSHFTCTCGEPVHGGPGTIPAATAPADGEIRCPGCGREWKPEVAVTWTLEADPERESE